MEKQAKVATKTAAKTATKTEQKPLQASKTAPPGKTPKRHAKTPQRRAGDVEQPWQRAKLDPSVWPFPAPIHGAAGLTWAVLPTGEKVKWSDLGMDRRLDERLKVWQGIKDKLK